MKKFLSISAFLHVSLLGLLILNEPPTLTKKEEPVKITVVALPEPKKECKPEPKPVEKPKPKPIQKPQPKPVEKPKPILEEKPVIEPVTEPEPIIEPVIQSKPEPKPAAESEPIVESEPVISEDEINRIKEEYLAQLRRMIQERKIYPKNAKRMKQQGVVKVKFTLLCQGTLTGIHIVDSSSFGMLDDAAAKLLKSINKVEPFPKELAQKEMVVVLPIEYELR